MNDNITKGHLRILRTNYEDACNAYLLTLLNMWDVSAKDGFWVGNEIGGLYSHGDTVFINMDEIIFCVENNINMEKFEGYLDYCVKCKEYGFTEPNLKSYSHGCPTVPQETFDKLDALRKELEGCINETKSKF